MSTSTVEIAMDSRWSAVARRDRSADGTFVYAVRTTGVYCRPSCASRPARRENMEFYSSPADAERAGFRACKRCRPDDAGASSDAHADAIARVCRRIVESDRLPDLHTLADAVGLSPSHFHRLFKSQTGLTPKAYAAAHRAGRVRDALARGKSVTGAMYDAGFSSSGRFYAESSGALGMKPSEFRSGAKGLTIRYAAGKCSLGVVLVASTDRGICFIALGDSPGPLERDLRGRFEEAKFVGGDKAYERVVAQVVALVDHPTRGLKLPLDIRGTAFQQRVWQKLREIPAGKTLTYAQIARALGQPKAVRAVAGACAANPISIIIPCHRVVRTDGSLAGYYWGVERKAKLLKAEGARD